jgi:D-alanyl-lipoteichoic acid acyltransferase DltB (MBOAT superfamily)
MTFLGPEWPAWLAAAVAGYWLLPAGWRQWFIAGLTLFFLCLHSPSSALLLAVFTCATYYLTDREVVGKIRLATGIAIILAPLIHFKLNTSASTAGFAEDALIPLGLSYYSFRCLHYIFERYRRNLGRPSFGEFVAYAFFLPTIVVGPIHRAPAFFADYRENRWEAMKLSSGLERILYGYVKIAVLGNYLVGSVLGGFIAGLDENFSALVAYLTMIQIGLNLYLQFAGFSDVAIGFALLLGYRIIENFNFPYLASNIVEFWRRWHISLTSWSRDYVYMPLLGATRNPYAATVASFLVIGLWHEISWRYVIWGLYHAGGVLGYQWLQRWRRQHGIPRLLTGRWQVAGQLVGIVVTVHFVWVSFAIVRQPDLASAARFLVTMLGLGPRP